MTEIAEALAKALLEHHRLVCRPPRKDGAAATQQDVQRCVLSYGELGKKARVSLIPRGFGPFLYEVHQWCTKEKKWPPLNSLAVNKRTRKPGENYPSPYWEREVRQCITFRYPDRLW